MYLAKPTKRFNRSFSKLKRSGVKDNVFDDLACVVNTLVKGDVLGVEYRDHKLRGDYEGYRECHIKADLLLVYQIQDKQLILVLLDIGTHSYLFG